MFKSVARRNTWLALVFLMVSGGAISAFVNNTAVVALMIPVVLSFSREVGMGPSRLLMPLSFASMLGGVCTLVGTSTNLLINSIAQDYGIQGFSMFEFASVGLVFFGVGTLYMVTIGIRLVPERRGAEDLAETWGVGEYLVELEVKPDAPSVGKTIADAPLTRATDVEVVQLRRAGGGLPRLPTGQTVLEAGDLLLVRASASRIKELLAGDNAVVHPKRPLHDEDFESSELILLELIVSPNSWLVGQTLRSVDFRNRFGGTVIALRHRGVLVGESLGRVHLSTGDTLLVETTRRRVPQFQSSRAFVVASGEEQALDRRPHRLLPALSIMTLVVAVAALGLAPIAVTAPVGAVAMLLAGCVTPDEAYRAIDWRVIFLIAGVLSVGLALESTGGAALLSRGFVAGLGGLGPIALVSAFYLATSLSTELMSNNATAVLMGPIAIAAAAEMGVDPRPLLIAITFAASASFMTPIGYQTNTMIYGPGQYRFRDFLRVGIPLNLILWITATLPHPPGVAALASPDRLYLSDFPGWGPRRVPHRSRSGTRTKVNPCRSVASPHS